MVLQEGAPGLTAIKGHQLLTSVRAEWGQMSLVEAHIQACAEVMVRCPMVQHIAVMSGEDVPLRTIRYARRPLNNYLTQLQTNQD